MLDVQRQVVVVDCTDQGLPLQLGLLGDQAAHLHTQNTEVKQSLKWQESHLKIVHTSHVDCPTL